MNDDQSNKPLCLKYYEIIGTSRAHWDKIGITSK